MLIIIVDTKKFVMVQKWLQTVLIMNTMMIVKKLDPVASHVQMVIHVRMELNSIVIRSISLSVIRRALLTMRRLLPDKTVKIIVPQLKQMMVGETWKQDRDQELGLRNPILEHVSM